MIHYITGNILESSAMALVNTVNLVGVMGKGIALQFKKQFPHNFKLYKEACINQSIGIGKLFMVEEQTLEGEKMIINFPTKTDWRKPSEYSYIEAGLIDLVKLIRSHDIKSIAIPPLGAGNGGLHWLDVRTLIERYLGNVNAEIMVYEPNSHVKEYLKKERVKLTDARALLLYVLFDLVRQGEYVSEFSSEKVCYFLQRFGAGDLFKLNFSPKYYGPYSGKVRYVLNAMNGSYIMGYSDMDRKPFEPLSLVGDAFVDVERIVSSDSRLNAIAERTMSFLQGFYSDFGLELLSSVDYIMSCYGDVSLEEIHRHLSEWSYRKGQMFNRVDYIDMAKRHIAEAGHLFSKFG